jgi:hypothetical protein
MFSKFTGTNLQKRRVFFLMFAGQYEFPRNREGTHRGEDADTLSPSPALVVVGPGVTPVLALVVVVDVDREQRIRQPALQ